MIDERDETEVVADLEDEYELLNELGRGGSAVVWRARDKNLGREVAIKVVHTRTAGANDDAIARLAREARTVAKLQHPNIVTVYAVRRLREGGLALVMQLVPGRTLKQAVADQGPFPAEQAERVIRDVAQALAYAHSQGVVHRDVKPENIFIDETSGRAMLSDFGIAHSAEFDSRLTMTGAAIGTPAYMSPEQIDGAPANARSDVYSLGLVSWEMLTGERPWEGETLYNVIFKQKHEELPTIDELRPNAVPARLQYIVERMLQKKPAARWAGADGLLTILTAWVVPSDWRQWEEAHQRHREIVKAATKGKASTPTSSAALSSQATVRFPRPKTPATSEAVVIPTNISQGATPTPAATTTVDEDDDAPSWASTPVPAKHGWRNLGIALALLFVAGSLGAFAWSTGRLFPTSPTATVASDAPQPVPIPALPSTTDSVNADSLNRLRQDSATVAAMVALQTDSIARASYAAALATARAQQGAVGAPAAAAPRSAGAATAKPVVTDVTPTVRSTDDRATIAAGGRHSCVASGGQVFCWGANDKGQLGNGEGESSDAPDAINGDIDLPQIVAGFEHSCGLTRGGDAYCWGSNERGQLGDATTTSRSAPVRVAGNLSFQLLRAGQRHTCGLTNAGDVACWGFNERGQLGDGSTNTRSSPVIVKAPVRFIALSTGWNHSCAISFDGVAYCWGDNSTGQLGDDSRTAHRAPEPVAGAFRFTSISAGSTHTCAVTEAGEAYCWGRNDYGQLGAGGSTDSNLPLQVQTPVRFASVSVGGSQSCGRTRAGQVWCWGRNNYGQLGDGSTTSSVQPVRVAGNATFTSINVTAAHSCGTTGEGETWCWGYNTYGQLGDGTRSNHARPARVTLPSR
ncbi:MAG: protein kinase domain-containing protein [Gemmatimonas sp.]